MAGRLPRSGPKALFPSETQGFTPLAGATVQVRHSLPSVIGRQAFVTCLEFTAAAPHAGTLAEHLVDPDIAGHVLDTLLKMRAPGYAARVGPLLDSPYAWIRRLAKRYPDRYPSAA